ncbi:uncharacterized protein A4U43_C03F23290 [Asparagus officinalis]|uniref:Uncharacterized protein n=1 Tax=Asparagus officinalis TaxID=4686 RepID=A0A5P1FDB2_ASPOF|nr:myosin-binding protein 1-like [Asparagus officinalis]ONK76044.1 uncharacterized protein A4U43_C03F23290 [Asparagus officinalis]
MRFACLCKLQAPCFLCSRLDHVFSNEKSRFYVDLICTFHKPEISSFAYCHVHRKLANVNEMFEGCLVSFATKKKSNSKIYRLLVGKLGIEIDENVDGEDVELTLLTKDHMSGSSVTNRCSCCFVPFRHKSIRVNERLSRKMESSLVSPSTHHLKNHRVDRLSHVGYSEVKANSDSELENPLSEDAEDLKEDQLLNVGEARELSPSPRVHVQGDDLKFFDASSSTILQNITKTLSIERNESGFESFDGTIVSEIEGESSVDRLKRQVELDRKSMYLLYKELEEE